MNPVLDSVNIDTFLILLHLFLLLASDLLLSRLLLERPQLLDLLRDKLVCFLQISLELVHRLILIFYCALECLQVLGGS